MNTKFETYIGFAIRARKIIKGTNTVKETRQHMHLIIICRTASENMSDDIKSFAKHRNIPIILLKDMTVEQLTNKENCKVIAITDKNLAKGIVENNIPGVLL